MVVGGNIAVTIRPLFSYLGQVSQSFYDLLLLASVIKNNKIDSCHKIELSFPKIR